jgi:hypothetical protein
MDLQPALSALAYDGGKVLVGVKKRKYQSLQAEKKRGAAT